MKAVIYARYSSDNQREESIDRTHRLGNVHDVR
jgi:predicted site-specific integrase-resolvase